MGMYGTGKEFLWGETVYIHYGGNLWFYHCEKYVVLFIVLLTLLEYETFSCSGRHFVWGGATFFCDLRRDFYSLRPLCCSCCRREKIFRGEIAAATDWNRYTSGHSFGCLGPKVALCVPQHKVRLRLGEFSLFSI